MRNFAAIDMDEMNVLDEMKDDVYDIVRQIPAGRVLTYGDVARLAGWPNNSRQVGRLMATTHSREVPCHRVVNATGRLVAHWPEQMDLLLAEGVDVKVGRTGIVRVNLTKYHWDLPEEE